MQITATRCGITDGSQSSRAEVHHLVSLVFVGLAMLDYKHSGRNGCWCPCGSEGLLNWFCERLTTGGSCYAKAQAHAGGCVHRWPAVLGVGVTGEGFGDDIRLPLLLRPRPRE